jgi:HEAT repeat protein
MRAGRRSTKRAAAVVAGALVAAALATGCETLGQDLNDLAKSLVPPSPAEAARMALDPHDPDRRREGTLLLGNSDFGGAEPYLRMYRDYIQTEGDPLVKAVAVRALARHGSPEDAELIAAQLEHPNVQVRWEAAKGLQRLHNPRVVPELLAVLRRVDEHADVRTDAALALGQYPEDRVFQGLVAALDARELALNVAAERSLSTITGESHGLDPRAWLNWYNAKDDNAFAGRQEYLYPTYRRKESWYEKLAFWSPKNFEQPAPPAGLRPLSERSTYEDDDDEGGAGEADG